MTPRSKKTGPSEAEVKLKSDLERARREVDRLKKESAAPAAEAAESLAKRVSELERIKERLSRLYFTQLDENRRRAARLHEILRALSDINADHELDTLVDRVGSSRVDLQACKLEYSIVSPK